MLTELKDITLTPMLNTVIVVPEFIQKGLIHAKNGNFYAHNQTYLKVVGCDNHKKITLTTMNVSKIGGYEALDDLYDNFVKDKPNYRPSESKLAENIIRAKRTIYELAYSNPWDYFITVTLNGQWYDRTNLPKFQKDLSTFIKNYRRKDGCENLQYLLIPEYHDDKKSWHMHGFISGLPKTHLLQFQLGMKMGKHIADKVKNGEVVYDWLPYSNKFGFCDLEPIKNHEAVSKYVTKYINKNLMDRRKDIGKHLYYASQGLQRAVTKKIGTLQLQLESPVFHNDYCTKYEFDFSDELYQYLYDNIAV